MIANGEEEELELKIAPVPLKLTKSLKPSEEKDLLVEGKTLTLEAEASKPSKNVVWLKNGERNFPILLFCFLRLCARSTQTAS